MTTEDLQEPADKKRLKLSHASSHSSISATSVPNNNQQKKNEKKNQELLVNWWWKSLDVKYPQLSSQSQLSKDLIFLWDKNLDFTGTKFPLYANS